MGEGLVASLNPYPNPQIHKNDEMKSIHKSDKSLRDIEFLFPIVLFTKKHIFNLRGVVF